MSTQSEGGIPDVGTPLTPSHLSGTRSSRKPGTIRTVAKSGASKESRPSRSTSLSRKNNASPRLPHDEQAVVAPSTMLYWSKAPIFGYIPHRVMRAHSVTLIDTVGWLFGGCDDQICSNSVFSFDTETMLWCHIDVAGELPPPSRAHTATAVDRKIVVYGGGQGSTYYDTVYVLDTVSRRWTRPTVTGATPPPRRAHTAVYLRGKIYIFGGGNGMTALNDVWTLDVSNPARMHWEEIPTSGRKPGHRGYHTATLIGNIMVVIGGSDGKDCFSDIWCLNLDSRRWTKLTLDTPHRRLSHACSAVGSYLFITGGHDGTRYCSELLFFNLTTLQFETRETMGKGPGPRGYHVTLQADSRLFVFGGFSGTTSLDEVYLLDLAGAAYLPQVTQFDMQTLME